MLPIPRIPEIRLISHTEYPVETLLATWMQSRPTKFVEFFEWLDKKHNTTVATAELVWHAIANGILDKGVVTDTFSDVIVADLPVSESIHFTWGFSNLPIEWREQAVRKRLWGFWISSMREFDMRNFADDGRFCSLPDTAVSADSLDYLAECMVQAQGMYNTLMDKYGWPQEKARKVIPLCATHNGTMFSSFRALRSTLQARSCYIAAIDQWSPWILGVVIGLRAVNPLLGTIVSPPCFKEGCNEFLGCKYEVINKNRLSGKDDYAPCPLYCMYEQFLSESGFNLAGWQRVCDRYGTKKMFLDDGVRLFKVWEKIWGRDAISGELLR